MANKITVSYKVWSAGEKAFQSFKKSNKRDPNYVTINNTKITLKDWKDSQNRVKTFQTKNKRNPATVSLTIPSTIKVPEVKTPEIIPVLHFNQQNVGKGYAEYCCGVVSSLICASHYNLVNRDNFLAKTYGLIEAMKTKIGSGTTPDNMVAGFNKFFTTLRMEKQEFSEANIKNNIQNNIPMVFNARMNKDFGYKNFNAGHYLAGTGYNGKVGISDPHGFNIGRGFRYWYNYNTLRSAVRDNGSRPIFRVVKR